MAEQKQETRIWDLPATPGNPTGLGGESRTGKPPTHTIYDGTEEHVKEAIRRFTDKQTLRDRKELVYEGAGEDKVLVSGPNYYQFIENDDWSKVFLDLDDAHFETLEEAPVSSEPLNSPGLLLRPNEVNEVSAESGAMSVIWFWPRSNQVNEVSAESGAMSVIWLAARFNEVNEVSAESGAMSVIWLPQRSNSVNEVIAGSPHFFFVSFSIHWIVCAIVFARGVNSL
eukprot:SAG22_NODE_350_length_11853_cov_3.693211_9_plen_227_part_00